MASRKIEPSPAQLAAANDSLADPRFFTRQQLLEAAKILARAFQKEADLMTSDELQNELNIAAEKLLSKRLLNSILPKEYS